VLPAWVPAAALLGLLGWRALSAGGWRRWRRPAAETIVCLLLAVAYRLPALLHPWGFVNKDGAYPAFVALHLLQGARPAPVFTEGAGYQGTLKAHLAALLALVTGARDLAWLVAAAGVLLSLVFLVATMALARRLGGRGAALAAGLYLALGPKFLTTFSLNAVGQYVDVLALGGLALAVLARLLDEDRAGPAARGDYLALGLLLGAAFWQQPVALAYVLTALAALALRRRTWRDPWAALVLLGLLVGALPVVIWNVQNGWASGAVLGRDPAELQAQADALPRLVRRTLTVAFPILAGLSPGHPWAELTAARTAAVALYPALLAAYMWRHGAGLARGLRAGRPPASLLPPLLALATLVPFWAVAAGSIYWRPRYLLPVTAAAAVIAGAVAAWAWTRSRPATAAAFALLLAVHVVGTEPRWREAPALQAWYRGVVRALESLPVRTGYADFSIAAPVTMFTAERITLSARLGPTPAYFSPSQERRIEAVGPDAFVLRPRDDPDAFAARLRALGVAYSFRNEPVPVFYRLSRRVTVEEVADVVAGAGGDEPE
jgi:dolichyl-phosphate-mannose-protein mannosyltransferase